MPTTTAAGRGRRIGPAPTLLVVTEPAIGITGATCAQLARLGAER